LVVLIFCLTFKGIVLCVFNAAGTDDLIMRILFHIQNIPILLNDAHYLLLRFRIDIRMVIDRPGYCAYSNAAHPCNIFNCDLFHLSVFLLHYFSALPYLLFRPQFQSFAFSPTFYRKTPVKSKQSQNCKKPSGCLQ
jgi:hypothetical protein